MIEMSNGSADRDTLLSNPGAQQFLVDRMTVIQGYTQMLLDETYGSLSPRQRQVLLKVAASAQQVNDFLRSSAAAFLDEE
jgi:hypothetical protein